MRPNGTGGWQTGPASIAYNSEAGGCIQYNDVDANGARAALSSLYSHIDWGSANYNGGFTTFAWVKLDSTANPVGISGGLGDWCVIFGRIGGKTNNNDFAIKKDGTQMWFNGRWRTNTNGLFNAAVTSDSFPSITNGWACIAMTVSIATIISKPTLTFYVNGVQVGSTKTPAGSFTSFSNGIDTDSSTGIFLGYEVNTIIGNWGQFKGKMGITAVYTKLLTASEILYNYNVTRYRYV
jgi:hypothetical protein